MRLCRRGNYAVTEAKLKINPDKKVISLNLQLDESICSMLEYFEIFLERMLMCRRAAGQSRKWGCPLAFWDQRLLLLFQMFIFSALAISSSRNCGWATEMMASAFCQVERPFKLTLPYSVTR